MIIQRLQIGNLRNLVQVSIEAHPGLNYLVGANGAGKTSVLEAIVVLSRGRSFRTHQAQELVGPEGRTFHVYAETRNGGVSSRLGLERSGKRWRGRIDGRDLTQLSELTRQLPVVLMEPDSHLLVSGTPEIRRKYLDWGMFHVEQGFLDTWRSFSKALKQRNAALRSRNSDILDSLDFVLAEQGEQLANLREVYLSELSERLVPLLKAVSLRHDDIILRYQPGWVGQSYLEALQKSRPKDLEKGMTVSGPHRADLLLSCGKRAAKAVLSRGEQKALAAALMLTQAEKLVSTGAIPVLLFDDLVSEFDREHFNRVLHTAADLGAQLWLTGTDCPPIVRPHKMFHVEQGSVSEMV